MHGIFCLVICIHKITKIPPEIVASTLQIQVVNSSKILGFLNLSTVKIEENRKQDVGFKC